MSASGSAELFDDQSFSKSKLYHWIIETCHEISGSIEATLRFIRGFESYQLRKLRERANPYEKEGLAHWTTRFGEEISELDTFLAEVNVFRKKVRELVRIAVKFSIPYQLCAAGNARAYLF